MGSSVQQRSLFIDCGPVGERLGKEMQVSSSNAKGPQYRGPSAESLSANQLARINSEEYSKGGQQGEQECEGAVVRASMFSSQFATEAFGKLTSRQQEYLTVYLRTLSPTLTAQELGLRSTKNIGKEIKRLAKLLGFKSTSAMKKDAGIDIDKEFNPSATYRELMQLIEQQGYRCALTGKTLTPQTARLDHKVPVSEGGSHDVSNLHWVLDIVNTAKGTMGLYHFVGM